jgi:hypothetical protein
MLRRSRIARVHRRPHHLFHPVRAGNLVEHILLDCMHIVWRDVEQDGKFSRADAAAECAVGYRLAQALRDGKCQFFRTNRAVRQAIDLEERKDDNRSRARRCSASSRCSSIFA